MSPRSSTAGPPSHNRMLSYEVAKARDWEAEEVTRTSTCLAASWDMASRYSPLSARICSHDINIMLN
jgi:hypothetical protein